MPAEHRGRIANPTIAEVLAQFLADQRARLAPRTFAQYEQVVDLLMRSLDSYAYQSLDKADAKLFDRLYHAEGNEHREYCEIFGPAHILPNIGEFLGYFMVRKVIAGKDLLRAAGTVMKKLAEWLADKGYAGVEDAGDAAVRGALLPVISRRPRTWRPVSTDSRGIRTDAARPTWSRITSRSRG